VLKHMSTISPQCCVWCLKGYPPTLHTTGLESGKTSVATEMPRTTRRTLKKLMNTVLPLCTLATAMSMAAPIVVNNPDWWRF
jgi:hypothetical protein